MWTCYHTSSHLFWGVWRWRNDITQFMSVVKELALFENLWQTTQLIWVDQLNRFLALHALDEGLGICWAMLGLKVPMLLNWVRFRPGIWDGGATSSTGCGAVCDRAPTQGCLGLALIRRSKLWDGHFTNISIEIGVQPSSLTHPLYLGFMVYQKYIRLIALCAP